MALDTESARLEESLRNAAAAAYQTSPAFETLIRSMLRLSQSTTAEVNARSVSIDAALRSARAQADMSSIAQQTAARLEGLAQSFITLPSQVASSNQAFSAVQPVLTTLTTAISGVLGATGDLAKSLGSLAGPIGAALGGVVSAITQFGEVGIRILSAGVQQQISSVQQLVNNFNQLSAAGLTFGANLETAKAAAAAGGLSLDTFSKIVSKNVENLTFLGGSATIGAKNIVGFTKDLPPAVRTIYGGFEGLNDAVIEYMANQQRLGIDANKNQAQLRAGAVDYLLNMKELSNLTGKSAKAMQADMERRAKQAAFQQAYQAMDEKQRQNFNTALQRLPANAANYLAELAYSAQQGMDVTSEFALKFQAAMPEQARLLRELQQAASTMSPEEFKQKQAEILASFAQVSDTTAKTMGPEMVLQATRGVGGEYFRIVNDTIAQTASMSGQLSGAIEAQRSASAETAEIANAAIRGFANQIDGVNTALEGLKGKLEDIAVKNFDKTVTVVNLLYQAADYMATSFGNLITYIDNAINRPPPPPPPTMSEIERRRRQTERGRIELEDQAALELQAEGINPTIRAIRQRAEEIKRRQQQGGAVPQPPASPTPPTPPRSEQPQTSTAANTSAQTSSVVVGAIDPNVVMPVRSEDLVAAIGNLPTRSDMESYNREVVALLTQIRNQA